MGLAEIIELIKEILDVLETPVIAATLIVIWLQLRLQNKQLRFQNKLARAANAQALVSLSSPYNMELINNRPMADFWVNGAANYPSMDDVDKYRFHSLLIWWLILHENIVHQREEGLLDEAAYAPWEADLEAFVLKHRLWEHWAEINTFYQERFVSHIQPMIERARASADSVPTEEKGDDE